MRGKYDAKISAWQEAFHVAGQIFGDDVEEFLRFKEFWPSWGTKIDEAL